MKIRNVEGAVHQGLVLLVPSRFLLTSRGLRGKTLKLESFANEITRVEKELFDTCAVFFQSIPSSSFALRFLSLLHATLWFSFFNHHHCSFSHLRCSCFFFFLFLPRLEGGSPRMTFANYGSELSYPWRLSWNVIDTIDGRFNGRV